MVSRVTGSFWVETTTSASTIQQRCSLGSECHVGQERVMATKTLNLPKMSYWRLKELSECKRPDQKNIRRLE